MNSSIDIVSAGSLNFDLNVYASQLPIPGETILGQDFATTFGGKGANQAIQAARLYPKGKRNRVAMIGCLGDDAFGQQYLNFLRAEGLDVSSIYTQSTCSTGVALISVALSSGENTIVVVPGANFMFKPDRVETNQHLRGLVQQTKVLFLQNEIPVETTVELIQTARRAEKRPFIIFSPAPAVMTLPQSVFELSDLVILNEVEAKQFLENSSWELPKTTEAVTEAFKQLKRCSNVIVTLGSQGCCLSLSSGLCMKLPACSVPKEKVIDTVGAGDSFAAATGFFLAQAFSLPEAARRAQIIAAQTVQVRGASQSYPYRENMEDAIFQS